MGKDKEKNANLKAAKDKTDAPDTELKTAAEGEELPGAGSEEDGRFIKYFKICGLSEKEVRNLVKDLITSRNPVLSVDTVPGEVLITLTASDEDGNSAKKLSKPMVKEIKNRFGLNIYATDRETTLEQSVVELLRTNSLVLATCESCTGGMVASKIIDVPGASDVFKEGFVTYSNKAKRTRLGVKKSTLVKYGAVSEQTAKEMVKGCASASKANVTLSTTGIAGPDGGTEDKPVGLVYIGCSVCGKTRVSKYNFEGDRMEIRIKATSAALALLRTCILEYYSEKNFS
jgi:nicotinamide-nucleotide amidase